MESTHQLISLSLELDYLIPNVLVANPSKHYV